MFNFITKYFKKDSQEFNQISLLSENKKQLPSISLSNSDGINNAYFRACFDGDLESIKEMFNQIF